MRGQLPAEGEAETHQPVADGLGSGPEPAGGMAEAAVEAKFAVGPDYGDDAAKDGSRRNALNLVAASIPADGDLA